MLLVWLFILATNGDLVVSQEVSNEMYAHFNEVCHFSDDVSSNVSFKGNKISDMGIQLRKNGVDMEFSIWRYGHIL